jgi:hypothetical protein
MTPYAFCLMIAKLYFSEHWEALTEENPNGDRVNAFDNRYFAAKKQCTNLDEHLFSTDERSQFHFT